jgi:hypothetical protein
MTHADYYAVTALSMSYAATCKLVSDYAGRNTRSADRWFWVSVLASPPVTYAVLRVIDFADRKDKSA